MKEEQAGRMLLTLAVVMYAALVALLVAGVVWAIHGIVRSW